MNYNEAVLQKSPLSLAHIPAAKEVVRSGDVVRVWNHPAITLTVFPDRFAIRIELRRGATVISVSWPSAESATCAAWMRELLK